MPTPSLVHTTHLSPDDLNMIVVALGSVTFTDRAEPQRLLRERLTRQLRKLWPEGYEAGVAKGDIEPPPPATHGKRSRIEARV